MCHAAKPSSFLPRYEYKPIRISIRIQLLPPFSCLFFRRFCPLPLSACDYDFASNWQLCLSLLPHVLILIPLPCSAFPFVLLLLLRFRFRSRFSASLVSLAVCRFCSRFRSRFCLPLPFMLFGLCCFRFRIRFRFRFRFRFWFRFRSGSISA